MNEHVDYKAKPANGATRFLWWCAGADAQILQYSSYSDYVKYVGIGGIVLGTGILASLSMFFAINYIFENVAIAIPVGLLWGAIIFNLDRFIVSSTGKGDGVDSISWKELGNATPRLLMAIILGFTISGPLEVYIFQKEIDKQLYKLDKTEQQLKEKEMESNFLKQPKFIKLTDDKSRLLKEREKLDAERLNYQQLAAKENTSEMGGCKGKCEEFKRMAEKVEGKIKEVDNSLGLIDNELKKEQGKRDSSIIELGKVNNKAHGLLDRLVALHTIPGSTVPAWMIRLMFVFIEIAPVLLKLMLIKSPYDYMTDNVNQILEAKQGINREHIVDEYKKIHSMKGYANPKRIIEVVEHQNIHETENAKEAITRFADQEKQDIINDPSAFVKPDKPS
jgi:hypothetical protein